MAEVLIFVPGLEGSELWDDQGKVWPGTLADGAFGFSDEKFARLCDPDLEARDILRTAIGVIDVYASWIDTFSSLSDRETGDRMFSEDGACPTLIAVPYDWRKSIEVGADALATAVAKAVVDHGAAVDICIAAHSLGGLVARYFLQSGNYESEPGWANVRTLLTFGTPHKGAVVALAGTIGQDKAQFLNTKQSMALVNDPRYPAAYHLFPQPGARPIWERGGAGRLMSREVFDRKIAKALGLTEANLTSAERIFKALDQPWPDLRYFLFVGTRFETMTHVLWDGVTAAVVKTKDGGDGTVNLQGAMLENHQIRFTDRNHMSLIKADETCFALQDIFNADGLLRVLPGTKVTLSIAELFVENRQPIEIALSVTGPGAEIEGVLFLERARSANGAEEIDPTAFAGAPLEFARDLKYDGPELTSLHIKIEDVTGPAVYRPVFETREDAPRQFYGPAFFVKRPE